MVMKCVFFFSSRRRHTRWNCDWSSDVCSSDLGHSLVAIEDCFLDLDRTCIEAPVVALIVFVTVQASPRSPLTIFIYPLIDGGVPELERARRAGRYEDAKAFTDTEELVLSGGDDQSEAFF